MSITKRDAIAAAQRAEGIVGAKPLFVGLSGLTFFVLFLRIREQRRGWSVGFDSVSPEFGIYWTTFLNVAVFLSRVEAARRAGYPQGVRAFAKRAPAPEVRRLVDPVQRRAVSALPLFRGPSFYLEQMAAWGATAARDKDFIPSDFITFYVSHPFFTILGTGAFRHAKMRPPFFAKSRSLAFLVLAAGVGMTIPNAWFNEWSRASWPTDEGFVGPSPWGFAFFGWMSLVAFGVTRQIRARPRKLADAEMMQGLRRR